MTTSSDAELDQKFQSITVFRDSIRKLAKASRKMVAALKDTFPETIAFGDALSEVVGLMESDSAAMPLLHWANAVKATTTFAAEFASVFDTAFSTPVADCADFWFNDVVDLQRKSERARADLASSQKKAAKGGVTAEDVDRARREFATCDDAFREKMREINQKRDPKFLGMALQGINAQTTLSSKQNAAWAALRPSVEELEKYIESCGGAAVASGSVMEGHLLEKTMLGWQKQFWVLKAGTLLCYKGKKGGAPDESIDVGTISARPHAVAGSTAAAAQSSESERTFEIVCSLGKKPKVFVLQAPTQAEAEAWIRAVQSALVGVARREATPRASIDLRPEAIIARVPGNGFCADCQSPAVEWVNLGFGITLCAECAVAHRVLGTVRHEQVQTISMAASDPVVLGLLRARGNAAANKLFEFKLRDPALRPARGSDEATRKSFVDAKYRARVWCPDNSLAPAELGNVLLSACSREVAPSLDTFASLLAAGASPDCSDGSRAPLHLAAMRGNLLLLELLVRNGATVNMFDARGWLPIHYAAFHNRPRCLMRLIEHGSRFDQDTNGVDPLTAASWNGATECTIVLLAAASSTGDRIRQDKVQPLTVLDVEADAIKEVPQNMLTGQAHRDVPDDTSIMLSAKIASPLPSRPTPKMSEARRALLNRTRSLPRVASLQQSLWELAKEQNISRRPSNPVRKILQLHKLPAWVPAETHRPVSILSFRGPAPRRRRTITVPNYRPVSSIPVLLPRQAVAASSPIATSPGTPPSPRIPLGPIPRRPSGLTPRSTHERRASTSRLSLGLEFSALISPRLLVDPSLSPPMAYSTASAWDVPSHPRSMPIAIPAHQGSQGTTSPVSSSPVSLVSHESPPSPSVSPVPMFVVQSSVIPAPPAHVPPPPAQSQPQPPPQPPPQPQPQPQPQPPLPAKPAVSILSASAPSPVATRPKPPAPPAKASLPELYAPPSAHPKGDVLMAATVEWAKRNTAEVQRGLASLMAAVQGSQTPEEGFAHVKTLRQVLLDMEPAQKLLHVPVQRAPQVPSADKLVQVKAVAKTVEALLLDILRAELAAICTSQTQAAATPYVACIEAALATLRKAGKIN